MENHREIGIEGEGTADTLVLMMTSPQFECFPEDYERFVGELSKQTWERGIIRDLVAKHITSGQILDAGAGTGIGARVLRAIGDFQITALDASAQMLERSKGLYDETVIGDLGNPPPGPAVYKAVVSAFDTLNYLSVAELTSFLTWASQNIDSDGVIVFDYSSPTLLRESWKAKDWDDHDHESGRTLQWRVRYLSLESRCHIQLTALDPSGSVAWREDHYQAAFDQYEMHCIAQCAGLEIESVRDLYKDTFSPDAHTHVFVLRKRQPQQETNTP